MLLRDIVVRPREVSILPVKRLHEVRDPLYGFVTLDRQERALVDSDAFQRLRHVQQLALTPLIYPGATHKRFEHSLGVMHLARSIFDVVVDESNVHPEVEYVIPDRKNLSYWKVVLSLAALAHDTGHLPFSHAAERQLLPEGEDHESLTLSLIRDARLLPIWDLGQPVRVEDVCKLAVGQKKLRDVKFSTWESLLSEIITGNTFGADRIDYLLRDSYHAGVSYGKFDYTKLIYALRILPETTGNGGSTEPRLGIELGGMHSAEALLLARYFMYEQVYFHPVRRIYDLHLIDFMMKYYGYRGYAMDVPFHLKQTDNEVMTAVRAAYLDTASPAYADAKAILGRGHFRMIYAYNPSDQALLRHSIVSGNLKPDANKPFNSPAYQLSKPLIAKFGAENVKDDLYIQGTSEAAFPVLMQDGRIESSIALSPILANLPLMTVDSLYASPTVANNAKKWIAENREQVLRGDAL